MFKTNRLLAMILAVAMMLTMSLTAFATNDVTDGNYTVEFSYMQEADLTKASTMANYILTAVDATVENGTYTLTFDYLNYFLLQGTEYASFSQIQQKVDGDWKDLTIVDVTDEYDDGKPYGRFTVTVDSLENITLNAYVDVMEIMNPSNVWSSFVAVPDVDTLTAVTPAAPAPFVPTANGTYVSDMVKAYQYYNPSQASMCNGVFAGEADVTIDGDWATLHLYLANPTAEWGGAEIGVLTKSFVTVDGNTYAGTLTSIGLNNDNAAVKLFTQDSSFFGIESGVSYACDTMEFVIPTSALASNIHITGTVNLVMGNEQSFWLDINWLEGGSNGPAVSTQAMEVTATVAKNHATSSVIIPEDVNMGELSKINDTVIGYAVEISEGYGQTVTVTADETVELTAGDATLTIVNDFDGANGTLTASAKDVAAVASYESDLDFSGALSFTITVA